MEFFMPEFREQVQSGKNIVVAGRGFGCGSSREQAVTALQGTGVQCVIAQSFAFIYGRNQPNLGLPGIIIQDEKFFQLAQSGEEVVVDMNKEVVYCGGERFPFKLSGIEKNLIQAGGLAEAFTKFGKHVYDALCKPLTAPTNKDQMTDIESLEF